MGVWAIRFFRTFLPLLAVSLALVSLSLTLFAGVRRDPYLDYNYVFKIDATNFQQHGNPTNLQGSTPANSIGLKNYYYVYLWNHCESNLDLKLLYCSDPRFDYYFDPVKLLKARLKRNVKVKIPSGSKSYLKRLRVTNYTAHIILAIGLVLLLATFLFVVIITLSGSDAEITSALSIGSTLVLVIGSGFVTGQYLELRNLIRDKASYLKVKGEEGHMGFFFLWLSCAFSLFSSVSLLLATRFIRKKRESAKLYH